MNIQAILTVLQIANQVVEAVEETNGDQRGAAKATLAVNVIGTIYNATEYAKKVPFSDIISQTWGIVHSIVDFKNTVGKFKKKEVSKAA